jgi:hypothetical protein
VHANHKFPTMMYLDNAWVFPYNLAKRSIIVHLSTYTSSQRHEIQHIYWVSTHFLIMLTTPTRTLKNRRIWTLFFQSRAQTSLTWIAPSALTMATERPHLPTCNFIFAGCAAAICCYHQSSGISPLAAGYPALMVGLHDVNVVSNQRPITWLRLHRLSTRPLPLALNTMVNR